MEGKSAITLVCAEHKHTLSLVRVCGKKGENDRIRLAEQHTASEMSERN